MPEPAHSTQQPAAPRIRVDRFTLGPFETNCYVVHVGQAPDETAAPASATSRPCWIIDASFEPAELIDHVRTLALRPQALILTHAHVDHIAGVHDLRRAFPDLPILIHEGERDWLTDPQKNLSAFMGQPVTAPAATRLLGAGEALDLAGVAFRVLHTPGHSPGGITLYQPESALALVGDTLFAGSIGRTDFPGSSARTLEHSIRTHLYSLPPATRVLPGHGPETTVERERRTNPFVRG